MTGHSFHVRNGILIGTWIQFRNKQLLHFKIFIFRSDFQQRTITIEYFLFSFCTDVATLPRNDRAGYNKREIISSIIRNAWSAAQKWTIARKAGGLELKKVADAVVSARGEDELKPEIHNAALQLKSSVSKMVMSFV